MRKSLLFSFLILLSGCSGGGGSNEIVVPEGEKPPTNLVYSVNSANLILNETPFSSTPSFTGTVNSFLVSPSLPAGLSINSSGVISGTPNAEVVGNFTITAQNGAGVAQTNIFLNIRKGIPASISYSGDMDVSVLDPIIAYINYDDGINGSRELTDFFSSPSLPDGLSFDSEGNITGFVNEIIDSNFTINATNSSGLTVSTSINLKTRPGIFSIRAGGRHTCYSTYIDVYCWGDNTHGQLGRGTVGGGLLEKTEPKSFLGLDLHFAEVGNKNTLIYVDDEMYIIGDHSEGQLAPFPTVYTQDYGSISGLAPLEYGSAKMTKVDGDISTCGEIIEDNGLPFEDPLYEIYTRYECFGGFFGGKTEVKINAVDNLEEILFYEVANGFACFQSFDSKLYCLGANDKGQVGIGVISPDVEYATEILDEVITFTLGKDFGCALKADGVYCWGDNSEGIFGDFLITSSSSPMKVQTILETDISLLQAGNTHACYKNSVDEIYCWGGDDHGQLGQGTQGVSSDTPLRVESLGLPLNSINFSVGANHNCAISDSALYCWGDNSYGQLGIGDLIDRLIPTLIAL